MTPEHDANLPAILRWYTKVIRFFAGTSLLIIVLVVLAQVVARYLFNTSLIWAEELCRYLLIWQTFLLAGYAFQKGEMVAVDLIPGLLSPKVNFVLKLILAVPILWFLWILTTSGYAYSQRFTNQIIPAFDFLWNSLTGNRAAVSIKYVYVSVAIGCGLLALHIIGALIADFLALRAHREQPVQHHLPEI